MRLTKNKVNLVIDLLIGVAFLIEALSGAVLALALPSGGYQGGRNPLYGATFLSLTRESWRTWHNWTALALGLGIILHFVLHWSWLTCTVRNTWKEIRTSLHKEEECPSITS
ncbi:MAG: DUF4405 domain-containing protein [Anaerolineae bacterium]|nr:DUF4405 domain-containing protein [Anaerolineae bacterium]